jgi:hypothetical protein
MQHTESRMAVRKSQRMNGLRADDAPGQVGPIRSVLGASICAGGEKALEGSEEERIPTFLTTT